MISYLVQQGFAPLRSCADGKRSDSPQI